ncbi:MAG: hypothetical protein DRN04_07165 [Thermoprotei archaeon]|nr:MAG: hypothetical protein DRN04_07165 [Thermoprotei archaeon]
MRYVHNMRFIGREVRRLESGEEVEFGVLEYSDFRGRRCRVLVTRVWFENSLIYLEFFSCNKRLLVKAVKYFGEFFGAFFFMKKKLVQYSGGYVYAFYNTQVVLERERLKYLKEIECGC